MGDKKKLMFYYIIFFIVMFVLSSYRLVNSMAPFTAPFVFTLIKNGFSPYIVLVEFFIAGVLVEYSSSSVLIILSQIGFAFLSYLFKVILKDKYKIYLTYVLLFLSHAAFIYFNFISVEYVVLSVLSITLSMLMLYVFNICIDSLKNKGYYALFSVEEKVAFSISIIALFMGLSSINSYVDFVKVVGVLVLLVASEITAEKTVFIFSVLAGLGASITNGGISEIALLPIFAVICCAIKNKYIKAFAIVLCDQLLLFVLNVDLFFNLYNLISMVIVALIFIALPNRFVIEIKENLGHIKSCTLIDYLDQNQRKNITKKLTLIAEAFSEVNRQYKSLVVGELNESKAIEFVTKSVYSNVCETCTKREECYKDLYVKTGIESFVRVGLKKNKITLLDVPLQISTCLRLNLLSEKINNEIEDIKKYANKVKAQDDKKLALSNQFLGTGELFKTISENTFESKIEHNHEKILIEKMMNANITVREVAEIYNNMQFKELSLLVKNEDVVKKELLKIASNVYKMKLFLSSQELSNESGWSVITLVPEPKLQQVVGIALSPKQEFSKSGDNYSITKINNHSYIFAIADGMGFGTKANKISESTLAMVENFYRAGISSDMISRCVNNIILPLAEENFSSLDLLQFDSSTGEADFIKMGASVSLLRRNGKTEIICGQSLPVGVKYNSKQSLIKRALVKNDIVILASDGIVDSFKTIEDFAKFVNNENILNMQLFAESILEEATARGGVSDDKTVLAIRFV